MSAAKSEFEKRRREASYLEGDEGAIHYRMGYTAGAQDPLIAEIISAAKTLARQVRTLCGCTYGEQCDTCFYTDEIQDATLKYEQAIKKE